MGMVFLAAPARSQGSFEARSTGSSYVKTRDKREDILLRVRRQVLALLQQDNGCSAWFHEADNDPAGVFQSLQFEIDKEKQAYVFRIADDRMATVTNTRGRPRVAMGRPQTPRAPESAGAFLQFELCPSWHWIHWRIYPGLTDFGC